MHLRNRVIDLFCFWIQIERFIDSYKRQEQAVILLQSPTEYKVEISVSANMWPY